MNFIKTTALLTATTLLVGCADDPKYTATLSGDEAGASGAGEIILNSTDQTIQVALTITGMSMDALFDGLVEAPIGPIHLHHGGPGERGPIAIPFVMSDGAYAETADGFTVTYTALEYGPSAALVSSELDFASFTKELKAGNIYFNVHTDSFPGGGLRGALGQ